MPAEATAISPTLPGEATAPVVPSAETSPADAEAAAAVEASGEPAGWGAAPAAETTPDVPTIPDAEPAADEGGTGLGAVAAGTGLAAGAAAAGGAALADDAAGDVAGGVADTAGGVTETAGAATESASDTVADLGADDAATAGAAALGGGVVDSADTAVGGVTEQAGDTAEGTAADARRRSRGGGLGVPAGWYADPSVRFELRYWDGTPGPSTSAVPASSTPTPRRLIDDPQRTHASPAMVCRGRLAPYERHVNRSCRHAHRDRRRFDRL